MEFLYGETFIYYDGSRLEKCYGGKEYKTIYLSLFLDRSEECDTWGYSEVSEQEIKDFEAGKIDLRSLFSEPAERRIYIIRYFDNDRSVEEIVASLFPEEYLPKEGFKLNV